MSSIPAVTYYQDAVPVFARRCTGCHTQGGIAPFSLATFADARDHGDMLSDAVTSKRMPPLPPDQKGCQPLDDFRNMSDDERNTLVAWVAGGKQEGDLHTAAAIAPVGGTLPAATDVFDSGLDYTSAFAGNDDYRCFIVDPHLTSLTAAIAFFVKYTNPQIVHHSILYAALPADASAVDQLDAADPMPGYPCFGGPGYPGAIMLSAQAPGAQPRAFPENAGIPLPAGTRFVVQMHYNFDNGRGTDHMAVQMWRATGLISQIPHAATLGNYTFQIPAGAPDTVAMATNDMVASTATPSSTQAREGMAWSAFPHMHQIGKTIRIDVVHPDGSSACLIQVPDWNFHWQGAYQFVQPVPVHAGDKLQMTCHWDNSAAHQPIVGGVQQAPRDVHFGEGSLDEMCLGGITMTNLR